MQVVGDADGRRIAALLPGALDHRGCQAVDAAAALGLSERTLPVVLASGDGLNQDIRILKKPFEASAAVLACATATG